MGRVRQLASTSESQLPFAITTGISEALMRSISPIGL